MIKLLTISAPFLCGPFLKIGSLIAPIGTELAIYSERTIVDERATVTERTIGIDRAMLSDRTSFEDRAKDVERTKLPERSNKTKKPNKKQMDTEALVKLSKDMKVAATTMNRNEARYLLSQYLTMQGNRKAADQKAAKMEERSEGEPHQVLTWISENATALEKQILGALNFFCESQPMGQWALAIDGVGPVVSAGLLAHIDIEKCPTVGHIWAFMGYDPSKKWEKGQKRPHNAALKQIGYYAGECFVRCTKSPYRKVYDDRKAYEQAKNEKGEYKAVADAVIKARPTHAQIKTYKEGKLPDGHIHSRCKRYAVKQFVSDWWSEAYRQHFKKEPPLPYPIAILGHAHIRKAA